MNAPAGLIGAAREAQEQLSRAGFRFCFVGGLHLCQLLRFIPARAGNTGLV